MDNLDLHDHQDEIAIIGMAARFPGAKNINEFWSNLCDGIESISFFSDQDLEAAGVDSTTLSNPNYVKAKALLEDIELFDASFFGFTPREAEITDPQHRFFLECAWEALENASYDSERYTGRIGVYAGAYTSTYFLFNLFPNPEIMMSAGGYQVMIGNDRDFPATRVSYKLNLRGPSVVVSTACSTSLVAVHLACQSLLNGECDMSLAGGVTIGVPQKAGYLYQEGGFHSHDGHCRAFDVKAQGFVDGNGVGIVVLKRLVDAFNDGDYVYAVIKGSAINNDGSLKVGYTAPSIDGQAEAIADAQAIAGIEPETITYIETHGAGTPLGDPIEIAALTQVFRTNTQKKNFCAIGSVKTNIGHTGAAAGIAGLIKTVLALKHQLIPPNLHFEEPNPEIDFMNSPFYVNTTLSKWETNGTLRRAGVSSLGMGGTNAHVILEEAPKSDMSGGSRPWQLLLLSAKTDTALETVTVNLAEYLKQHPHLNLADVAFTLQVGRREFNHRRVIVCQRLEDGVHALETLDPRQVFTGFYESGNWSVVFMFPGGGDQYINMGRRLYETESIFREQVDLCVEFLKPQLGLDLRDLLYPQAEQTDEAKQQLKRTFLGLPALFVTEYALAELWMSWGIRPQAMIGHSLGEYVAACLAGVFSLEDALTLVALRGTLFEQLPEGVMLTVPLSEQEVRPLLGEGLSLAALNGPSLCVVSGSVDVVNELQKSLTEKGVISQRIPITVAAHSELVTPILETFSKFVEKVKLRKPNIPFVSNVTGTWITDQEATDPIYWAKHLRQTVRFSEGVRTLLQDSGQILLEVGPGRTLSALVKKHLTKTTGHVVLSSLRHSQRRGSDVSFMLKVLGQLWLAGISVDWSSFYTHEQRRRLPLPTYPFERQPYWIEAGVQIHKTETRESPSHESRSITDWFYVPSWKRSILPQCYNLETLAEKELCWLVFNDTYGIGSQVANRLKQKGQDVITVTAGEQFEKLSDDAYKINPRERRSYEILFQNIKNLDRSPHKILYFWGIIPDNPAELEIETFENGQEVGLYSLLFLAQVLGEQDYPEALEIVVVSNNMQEVTGEERLCPEKMTMLGLCRVLPQEYPNVTCRSIDIILPESGTRQEEKLIEQFMLEISINSSDIVIAYRGSYRWIQVFEAIQISDDVTYPKRLRTEGVYLITGGLGGVGFLLAEYLAQAVQAKLILVARSELPPRDEWDLWLATQEDQGKQRHNLLEKRELDWISVVKEEAKPLIQDKIRKVKRLEALGAEVQVFSVDAANLEQMRTVVDQIYEKFGEIHGVIHTAAVAGGGLIQIKTIEMMKEEFAPKVVGALVLDTMFKDRQLDFLVFCSSINAFTGGFGQVGYCAANAFLDAFAHYRASKDSSYTVSINWERWRDVGMAVDVQAQHKALTGDTYTGGMAPEEGVEVFRRILFNNALSQVIVSIPNFQTLVERFFNEFRASNTINILKKVQLTRSLHLRPELKNIYVAPRNELEQRIANIWQEVLGIEQVGIYDDLFELGGDSLVALQLLNRVQENLQMNVPLRSFFETPTVLGLSAIVDQTRVEQQDTSSLPLQITPQKSKTIDEILRELNDENA